MNYPYQQPGFSEQQQLQLPFPKNAQVLPFIGLNYGQPPFVPNIQCPPQLQQWLALIAYEAINALQTDAQRSELRMFLYNQMSANGYQNNDFYDLVAKLTELVNLFMSTQGGQDIQRAIVNCAQIYIKYKSADNCFKFQGLLQGIPRDAVMQIEYERKKFIDMASPMEMVLQRQSGAQMGYQQPMQNSSYGQPIGGGFGGQQQSYRPPMGQMTSSFQPPSASKFDRPGNVGDWRANVPTTQFSPPAGSLSNQPPASVGDWKNNHSLTQDRFVSSSNAEVVSVVTAQSNVTFIKEPQTSPAQNETQQGAQKSNLAGQVFKAGDPGVDWKSSEKYPYTFAFNPNCSEVYYRFDDAGYMQPILTKKELNIMDRQTHLATPSIAPSWSTSVPTDAVVTNADSSLVSKYQKIEDLVQVEEVPRLATAISNFEHIVKAKVAVDNRAAIVLPNTKKPTFIVFPGVTIDAVAAKEADITLVESIVKEPTTTSVLAGLNKLTTALELGNTPSQKLKRAINKRLTARINKFVKKELALTSGAIGSYEEDIVDLVPYLTAQFGEATAKIFNDAHARLVKEALTFATGDSSTNIEETYFEFVPKKEESLISQISFLDFNQYLYVDLTSTDLSLDFSTRKTAVGVLESELPLVYALAKKALTSEDNLSLHNHYLITSDDVIFEVTRGGINPDYIFMSLADIK